MIGRLFACDVCVNLSFTSSDRFKMLFIEKGLLKTGCACGRTCRSKDAMGSAFLRNVPGRRVGVKSSTFGRQRVCSSKVNQRHKACMLMRNYCHQSLLCAWKCQLVSMSPPPVFIPGWFCFLVRVLGFSALNINEKELFIAVRLSFQNRLYLQ